MTWSRVCGVAFAASLLWLQCAAAQTTFPARPIRMLVPFSPGGASDTAARVVSQHMGPRLAQQIVIENRPGAGGTIGTELAAKATPDGHTLLMASNTEMVINPNLYRKLPYDTIKDFTPVSLVANTPLIIVVHPSVAAKNVQELVALAKARPGAINYASSGNGSTVQLATEMFKTMSGINLRHIPFNGSAPAVVQTIAGETHVMFPAMPAALQHARSGKLRALAVTTAKRVSAAPELPTVAESGMAGFDIGIWNGLVAPAGTPKPVLQRLYAELAKTLAMPEVVQSFGNIGAEVMTGGPAEFAGLMTAELAKYAKVVKDANVRID
ncbi:MAG TPA: tripartite tricarboxylate transporter substrate binding protein [Opitutaceae bacterium]|nr:tripartite tricarboxylate transporter substrate binding protein [Opitutaceae bacterium]